MRPLAAVLSSPKTLHLNKTIIWHIEEGQHRAAGLAVAQQNLDALEHTVYLVVASACRVCVAYLPS